MKKEAKKPTHNPNQKKSNKEPSLSTIHKLVQEYKLLLKEVSSYDQNFFTIKHNYVYFMSNGLEKA